ncbi:MAG: DUF1579 domain-containing protein [Gemmatimonadales bacterium]|nr:MAG: DUF1579 domain-containing protein [Gemmatimonadales bacterium]
MKSVLTAAFALGVLAGPAIAQEMPAPGAEQARIGYYEGTRNYQGEAMPSPMGPGGKIAMTETCRWFEGGFHMICDSKGTSPTGPVSGHSVIGYDRAEQMYVMYGLNSRGEGYYVKGGIAGAVWTWTAEIMMESTPVKFRAIATEKSPTSYDFRLEASMGDADWAVLEEGKATKQ